MTSAVLCCIHPPYSFRPDSLVEFSVHADIRSPHLLLSKLLDCFDGSGGTLFEPPADGKGERGREGGEGKNRKNGDVQRGG